MEKIRRQFPVLRQYIYANTAVFGLFYDDLLEWRQEHDLDFLLGASAMRTKSLEIISNTRKAVGKFFGCEIENVALVNNFSLGLNILLEEIDKNTTVLLLDDDYPSVNWAFEKRGLTTYYAKINENLEQNILEVLRNENISILALSLVQWLNGIKIDLDFLQELKKEFPDLTIIADGTQFCGATNFNFKESGIDILGASAYKWLLAGYGNGFMLFKDDVKDKFQIKTIGFNAADGEISKRDKVRFAKQFEPGHLSCLNFGSLKYSIDFFNEIGMDKISVQNKILSQKAKKEFTALGLLEEAVTSRNEHSTIFNIKGDDTLFQHLIDNDVICSQRGNGIRLSFHFYNTEKDIDAIVRILKTTT